MADELLSPDPESDFESPSGSDSTPIHDSNAPRSNRWQGPQRTWLNYTKLERDLASSLDLQRNRDLSIHLYNAHSLRRRAREISAAEAAGVEVKISVLEDTGKFVPPRAWAAWPLPAEEVPRVEKNVEDGMSGELEEVLVAYSLRFAKERFGRRREEKGDIVQQQGFRNQEDIESDMEIDDVSGKGDSSVDSGDSRNSSLDLVEQARKHGIESGSSTGDERRRRSTQIPTPEMIPVVSTDDDRSRQLLRPSVRSTLSKLDDVLLALHQARSTCQRMSKVTGAHGDRARFHSVGSQGDGEPVTPVKRGVGRPPNYVFKSNVQEIKSNSNPAQLITDEIKREARGRKKKQYPRLEEETDQEYLIRIARLQKKPLPSFAAIVEARSSSSQGRSQPPTERSERAEAQGPLASRRPNKELTQHYKETLLEVQIGKKLRKRDWSEVLGAAALVGFDPKVIDRATKRCVALFGESMTMRTVFETPFDEPRDPIITYRPEMIPKYYDGGSSMDEGSSDKKMKKARESSLLIPRTSSVKNNFLCHITDCNRRTKSFRDNSALMRHLRNVHKISEIPPAQDMALNNSEEENEEYETDDFVPSDEEMEGGIHVDGFLKPVHFESQKGKSRPQPRKKRRSTSKEEEMEESEHEIEHNITNDMAIDYHRGEHSSPKHQPNSHFLRDLVSPSPDSADEE